MILLRRATIALLLAGFRMWRRLPPEDRARVYEVVRRQGPRVASSLSRRGRARMATRR